MSHAMLSTTEVRLSRYDVDREGYHSHNIVYSELNIVFGPSLKPIKYHNVFKHIFIKIYTIMD